MRLRHLIDLEAGEERRQNSRYVLPHPIGVTFSRAGQSIAARLTNVSLCGCRLEVETSNFLDQEAEKIDNVAEDVCQIEVVGLRKLRSRLRWRDGEQSGFAFLDQEPGLELFAHCMKSMLPSSSKAGL